MYVAECVSAICTFQSKVKLLVFHCVNSYHSLSQECFSPTLTHLLRCSTSQILCSALLKAFYILTPKPCEAVKVKKVDFIFFYVVAVLSSRSLVLKTHTLVSLQ